MKIALQFLRKSKALNQRSLILPILSALNLLASCYYSLLIMWLARRIYPSGVPQEPNPDAVESINPSNALIPTIREVSHFHMTVQHRYAYVYVFIRCLKRNRSGQEQHYSGG